MPTQDAQIDKLKKLTVLWADAQPKVAGFVGAFIHNFSDAQDIVQEVAQSAVESIDSYDLSKPFGPWILGVARFKVIDHLRKHGKDRLVFDSESITQLAGAYIKQDSKLDDMKSALSDCMQGLSKRDRQALDLRYVDDAKPAEVADELHIKPGTARVLLHRIRQALAECVRRKLAEQVPGVKA
ncbi:MAG: sigma-70 family RNA polymerase sigma factor [Phycisphaeraceae bacterium]